MVRVTISVWKEVTSQKVDVGDGKDNNGNWKLPVFERRKMEEGGIRDGHVRRTLVRKTCLCQFLSALARRSGCGILPFLDPHIWSDKAMLSLPTHADRCITALRGNIQSTPVFDSSIFA